jgi:hypothetical protein
VRSRIALCRARTLAFGPSGQNGQRSLGWADPGRALIRVGSTCWPASAAMRENCKKQDADASCKRVRLFWSGLVCSALPVLLSLLCSASSALLRSPCSPCPSPLRRCPPIEWQPAACTLASRWHTTREGSYSCVQQDLEPANHACSCASLDRGLHELAGMQALRSSVSSNLHVCGLNLTQVPPPPFSPAHD